MNGVAHFGPSPWRQTSWDARAAGNFIAGGAGAGLIVFTALAAVGGRAFAVLIMAGLALVAVGLFLVALELGRPLRAWRVLANPRTSWMSREAWGALALLVVGFTTAFALPRLAWLTAALALAFIYCQARIVQAAKGIPAWREPLVRPLLVTSGLVEGGGVLLASAPLHGAATTTVVTSFGVLLLARFAIWVAYRRRIDSSAAPAVRVALDRAGRLLLVAGTLAPLALVGVGLLDNYTLIATALAGALAAFAGAFAKLVIVTRAGFNQGFALARMPVRGVRRLDQRPKG